MVGLKTCPRQSIDPMKLQNDMEFGREKKLMCRLDCDVIQLTYDRHVSENSITSLTTCLSICFGLRHCFYIKDRPVIEFPNFHGRWYGQTATLCTWCACSTNPSICAHLLRAAQQDIDLDFAKLISLFHFTSVFSMRLMMVDTGAVLSGSTATCSNQGIWTSM